MTCQEIDVVRGTEKYFLESLVLVVLLDSCNKIMPHGSWAVERNVVRIYENGQIMR